LTDFANSIGGSPYFNINTTYCDASDCTVAGTPVNNAVSFGGSAFDNYSLGSSLTNASIRTVVVNAIGRGDLPRDPNGVYFVLTSADVSESGFCSSFCGWHTHTNVSGTDIKYSFVGNPMHCSSTQCMRQRTVSPNDNPGADGMVNIIAHELEEAATDPDLNAWFDSLGRENADKCVWTFGTTYTVANGSVANMKLGTRDYLIQRNWVNASGGYCALHYP